MDNKKKLCLNAQKEGHSLTPLIKESERFIKFLIDKFQIEGLKPYIVVLSRENKKCYGLFANVETNQHYSNNTEELNTITLNTLYLKDNNAYKTLAHELAHFINYCRHIKDCSSNQYHNKYFKIQVEKFYLKCNKTKNGFSDTIPTEEFNKMLKNEFKANEEVFNLQQNQNKIKNKSKSRLRLYICNCGIKLRCASDTLKANCKTCDSDFILNDKKDIK